MRGFECCACDVYLVWFVYCGVGFGEGVDHQFVLGCDDLLVVEGFYLCFVGVEELFVRVFE